MNAHNQTPPQFTEQLTTLLDRRDALITERDGMEDGHILAGITQTAIDGAQANVDALAQSDGPEAVEMRFIHGAYAAAVVQVNSWHDEQPPLLTDEQHDAAITEIEARAESSGHTSILELAARAMAPSVEMDDVPEGGRESASRMEELPDGAFTMNGLIVEIDPDDSRKATINGKPVTLAQRADSAANITALLQALDATTQEYEDGSSVEEGDAVHVSERELWEAAHSKKQYNARSVEPFKELLGRIKVDGKLLVKHRGEGPDSTYHTIINRDRDDSAKVTIQNRPSKKSTSTKTDDTTEPEPDPADTDTDLERSASASKDSEDTEADKAGEGGAPSKTEEADPVTMPDDFDSDAARFAQALLDVVESHTEPMDDDTGVAVDAAHLRQLPTQLHSDSHGRIPKSDLSAGIDALISSGKLQRFSRGVVPYVKVTQVTETAET